MKVISCISSAKKKEYGFMDHKVSIIIPVYQTENYLNQCVDSVLGQTYKNLEIILVDDGSKDESPSLCDEYAVKDTRVRVIHQKNGGLSRARNNGMKAASGNYLLFLDSDDYWDDQELVQKLVDEAGKSDCEIVNFRYKFLMEKTGRYRSCLPSVRIQCEGKQKAEILQELLEQGLFIASACNKLLSIPFLRENRIFFREGITSEDVDWCARILLLCKNMGYCDVDAYVYRQREGSITHTVKYENILQLTDNIKYCVELGRDLKEKGKMDELYDTYLAYQYGVFLTSNHYAKDKRVVALRKEMKQYRWLLQYRKNAKVRMLYLLNKHIGFTGMNVVMAVYSKIR